MTENDDAADAEKCDNETDSEKLVGQNLGTSKIYKDADGNEFLYCGRTKNASWSELTFPGKVQLETLW